MKKELMNAAESGHFIVITSKLSRFVWIYYVPPPVRMG